MFTLRSTIGRFALVGVANTLIGITVIYALKWILNAGDSLSNLVGYAVGFSFSFTFNRKWTFRSRNSTWATFVKFALVILVGYLLNLIIVLLAVNTFHFNSYVAQAMGILPYSGFTFLGCRYWVFVTRDAEAGSDRDVGNIGSNGPGA